MLGGGLHLGRRREKLFLSFGVIDFQKLVMGDPLSYTGDVGNAGLDQGREGGNRMSLN